MLAFSIDYYGIFFGATQSVELFCTYRIKNTRGLSAEIFSGTSLEMLCHLIKAFTHAE